MLLQVVLNGIVTGSTYALLVVGFSLIYATTGILHFAHAAYYTVAAYIMYALSISLGLNPILGLLGAIAVATLLCIATNRVIYEPLKAKRAPPFILLLSSLGVFALIIALTHIAFGSEPKAFLVSGLDFLQGVHRIGDYHVTTVQIAIVVLAGALLLGLALLLAKTKVGIAIRAQSGDAELAQAMGMRIRRSHYLAFIIGTLLAAIAAILVSLYSRDLSIDMGVPALIIAMVATILAGEGAITSAALTGFIIGLLYNLGHWYMPVRWAESAVYGVLILVLIVKPQGLFGARISRLEG